MIGIPYLFKAQSHGACDCVGLIKMFYEQQLKIETDEFDILREERFNVEDVVNKKSKFKVITDKKLQRGDVLLINLESLLHAGVMINKDFFLHTTERTGSCLEKVSTWKKKIIKVYRHETC